MKLQIKSLSKDRKWVFDFKVGKIEKHFNFKLKQKTLNFEFDNHKSTSTINQIVKYSHFDAKL